jgi:hypothetical protein
MIGFIGRLYYSYIWLYKFTHWTPSWCCMTNLSMSDCSLLYCFDLSTRLLLLEFTNPLPFITVWEPDRDHRLQESHSALRECFMSESMCSFPSNRLVYNLLSGNDSFTAIRCNGKVISVCCLAKDVWFLLHYSGFSRHVTICIYLCFIWWRCQSIMASNSCMTSE